MTDERATVQVMTKEGKVCYRGKLVYAGPNFFTVQVADFDVLDFSRRTWNYKELKAKACGFCNGAGVVKKYAHATSGFTRPCPYCTAK